MFNGFKLFYVNGCSHSEGGGLEDPSIRGDSRLPYYEKYYGVTWKNKKEVNYGSRLSEILNIPCVNESKSGGGVDRVIRKTYDFLSQNWSDREKLFLILEKPDSSRSDIFYNKTKEYHIVNTENTGKELLFSCATRDYWIDKKFKEDMGNYQEDFKIWYKNHYDFNQKSLMDEKNFIGLYSFCKLNKIRIILMNRHTNIFENIISESDVIKFGNSKNFEISKWCEENKKSITYEMNSVGININDGHPGFFGHIEYSIGVAKFLGYDKEINIFNKYYEK